MKKLLIVAAWWFVMSMGGDNAPLLMVGPFALEIDPQVKTGCRAVQEQVLAPAIVVVPCFFKSPDTVPRK